MFCTTYITSDSVIIPVPGVPPMITLGEAESSNTKRGYVIWVFVLLDRQARQYYSAHR